MVSQHSQPTSFKRDDTHDGGFEQSGYAVLRKLIPESVRSFLYEYALKTERSGGLKPGDASVPGAACCYADPFMDCLLEMLRSRIETESRRRLYPTYSYLRIYKRGDVLHRHQDRPSCEVSVTLTLGYDAGEPWPIWVESGGVAASCGLEPGEAMLYKGIEVPHWRDAFQGEHCAQVFLHYVDQDGPYADWIHDKRSGLRTSPAAKQIMKQIWGNHGQAIR